MNLEKGSHYFSNIKFTLLDTSDKYLDVTNSLYLPSFLNITSEELDIIHVTQSYNYKVKYSVWIHVHNIRCRVS